MPKKPDPTKEFELNEFDTELAKNVIKRQAEEKKAKVIYDRAEGKRKNAQYLLNEAVTGLNSVPGEIPIVLIEAATGEDILKMGKARSQGKVDILKFIGLVLQDSLGLDGAVIEKLQETFRRANLDTMLTVVKGSAEELAPEFLEDCSSKEHTGARQIKALMTVPTEENNAG